MRTGLLAGVSLGSGACRASALTRAGERHSDKSQGAAGSSGGEAGAVGRNSLCLDPIW